MRELRDSSWAHAALGVLLEINVSISNNELVISDDNYPSGGVICLFLVSSFDCDVD